MAPKMKKFDGVRWTSMALDGTCEPHSVGPSAQTSKKAGFNNAGGGTPAHFYAPRAPPRRRSRKFSRKFVKKSYFANFSDAPDARGHRELPVVKISALNDPWRYQKRQKKLDVFSVSEISFSSFLINFGGTTAKWTSKSDSASRYTFPEVLSLIHI